MSYRKRQLLKEAVYNYRKAKKKSQDDWNWRFDLNNLMLDAGWNVEHPGSDKYVAIKGPLIAKWDGRSGWDRSPIKTELKLYSVLNRLGLAKHTPRVYLSLSDFVVQQYLGKDTQKYHKLQSKASGFYNKVRDLGYELVDCRVGNVILVGNKIKVIDGRADPIPSVLNKLRQAA